MLNICFKKKKTLLIYFLFSTVFQGSSFELFVVVAVNNLINFLVLTGKKGKKFRKINKNVDKM